MPGGLHLLIDARASLHLSDREAVVEWMREAARLMGVTILGVQSHLLPTPLDSGPGVSAVQVIAESHLAIHTWPEQGIITADTYSCIPFNAQAVSDSFAAWFGVTEFLVWQTAERWGISELSEASSLPSSSVARSRKSLEHPPSRA